MASLMCPRENTSEKMPETKPLRSSSPRPSCEPKPKVKPRRKRGSGSEPTVTPNGVLAKKLPVIGPPVAFTETQLKVTVTLRSPLPHCLRGQIAFAMLDTNHDGRVNSDELRDMLSRLGLKDVINDALISSLISDATRNGKGVEVVRIY